MEIKKLIVLGLLFCAGFGTLYFTGSLTGCVSANGSQGFQSLETMSDVGFAQTKLLTSIGIKVAANRLLINGQVSQEDINLAVGVLKSVTTTPVIGSANEFTESLLAKSGLTNIEIKSLVELVVFELDRYGLLAKLNSEGTISLTPRTAEFLDALTQALQESIDSH